MLPATAPIVVVQDDLGGSIAEYGARINEYHRARVVVQIRGECASACTLVTLLPAEQVCVAPAAYFEFHAAFGSVTGRRDEAYTAIVHDAYPAPIRRWIDRHGGLTERLITLKGAALRAMFRSCER